VSYLSRGETPGTIQSGRAGTVQIGDKLGQLSGFARATRVSPRQILQAVRVRASEQAGGSESLSLLRVRGALNAIAAGRPLAALLKRAVDVLGAGLGLVVLSPVLILTAAAIALTGGRRAVRVRDCGDTLAKAVESMLAGLKHFRYRRHDVIVVHLLDPAEIDFPFQQVTLFKGLEALGDVVTEPRSLRTAYEREVQAFLRQVRTGCRAQQVDYLLVRTDQPLDTVLRTFLSARKRRVK